MTDDAIQIREFREGDLDAVVAFSLRAWEPVFDSLREVLGDEIFLRLHPDWRSNQAEAVKSSCLSEQRDVFVAVADGKPVGFAAVALNAFHEGMGVIEIIGVDPDYQRRGIRSRLTEHATEHMRGVAWTSWSSRPAAIPATHLRGRHTKPPASQCSRSPAISECSGDIPERWLTRTLKTPRDPRQPGSDPSPALSTRSGLRGAQAKSLRRNLPLMPVRIAGRLVKRVGRLAERLVAW